MPRSKLLSKLLVALLAGAALWYMWMITSAKLEWGGDSPDQQQLGAVKDTRLRAMTQYCTGVTVTPQGTWLVARLEREAQALEPSAGVVNLDAVVYGKPAENEEPEALGTFSHLFSRAETETSFISRLDDQGQFQLVAHVSGAACLVASPDGTNMFLLTGLRRPETANTHEPDQTVVFRSDDQGQHWTWLTQGWFPEVDSLAWSLVPYFHGANEVWAVGKPDGVEDDGAEAQPTAVSTGVFYSADRGAHSSPVMAPESLLVPAEYAHGKRPDITEWGTSEGEHGEVHTDVLQLDTQTAFIWVSQRFWGSHPDGVSDNVAVNVTTRARLQAKAGQWQVVDVQRDDNLFVSKLIQNDAGKVMGLIDQGNHGQTVVAELDTAALTWTPMGDLPSVFSPLASQTQVRGSNFWMGQNTLLINTTSEHHPPRWLYWWSDANISANGVFYSKDWGRSWQRLAIGGYLGVLGFEPVQDRVFRANGNWYDSNDGRVYSYGLR
ncbi:hypothetical protein ACNT2N_17720 [Pseudomonas thivervalensis]|uniref:Uncharacterized protein n=1 Tax=Pseudomonas thivervalensis TaxID=86265 RepID=A0A2Z4ZR41_9PSED|nr:hypothetical protein [Pseudomonas thivervalensis]AXA54087.1 hypothetical protein CE140_06855 [Pseudomonas thivervalensis]AXA59771.1 hypothetical protein CEQ51_06700 [Pseudomonas thivervalensis]